MTYDTGHAIGMRCQDCLIDALLPRYLMPRPAPSLLGGDYAMDDHNHAHTPLQMIGIRDDEVAVIGDAS